MLHKQMPDNPDPARYIIVRTKEGYVIRKKRTDPSINEAFKKMADETCSTAAKQIVHRLKPFTSRMGGRMTVRISGKLRSANKRTGSYNYSLLQGFELQKDYPLDALYSGQYRVRQEKRTIYIDVPVTEYCMQAHNNLVTQFYFEAVAVFGDAMKPGGLKLEDDKSPLFDFGKKVKTTVSFSFVLPAKKPFMIWLKAGCLEGREDALHARHYGMKVVAVG